MGKAARTRRNGYDGAASPSSIMLVSRASFCAWRRGAERLMPQNSYSGCFAVSSRSAFCRASKNLGSATCRRRWQRRNITISPTGSGASRSSTCMRRIARPGSAIRRRAGSGRARRSAAFPVKCRVPCCADGTPTTAFRWAIPISVSSAPSRVSMVRTDLKVTTSNTLMRSRSISAWCSRVISRPPCSTPRPRRPCPLQAGRSRGWKRPTAITQWNMCGPPRP